jgi:hypothetical protein
MPSFFLSFFKQEFEFGIKFSTLFLFPDSPNDKSGYAN